MHYSAKRGIAIACRLSVRLSLSLSLSLSLCLSVTLVDQEYIGWLEHLQGPSEQNPVKNFGEKGMWAWDYPILGYPVIPGTGKVSNFKFCTHIHSVSRKKTP